MNHCLAVELLSIQVALDYNGRKWWNQDLNPVVPMIKYNLNSPYSLSFQIWKAKYQTLDHSNPWGLYLHRDLMEIEITSIIGKGKLNTNC